MGDTRVVVLTGPRQAGKTTLARAIATERGGTYVTLDDPSVLSAARNDPAAFLNVAASDAALVVIDEAQNAPDLFRAIKIAVDEDPRPGRFLLTGSADVLALPAIAESLAGRMEPIPMLPLAQCEIESVGVRLPELFFSAWRPTLRAMKGSTEARLLDDRIEISRRIVTGGFPEVVRRESGARRDAWFRSYVTAMTERDIRNLGNIEGLSSMPALLGLLAARSASLMNMSELSRSTQVPHSTLRRYLSLLEATFLLTPLPAWSPNIGKRFVKASKIHLVDSGLAAHLRGEQDPVALAGSNSVGPLIETFVLQELRKQIAWSEPRCSAYHYRTPAGREVDIVLEAPGGRVVGVEVKAGTSVGARELTGLEALAEDAGDRFVRGVVFYLGDQIVPLRVLESGATIVALPVATLWRGVPE